MDKNQISDRTNLIFPQKILNFGFRSAIVFAGLCLLATVVYLVYFLFSTSNAVQQILLQPGTDINSLLIKDIGIKSRLYMAGLSLTSCGIMVGMSFGFLGFGLFLIGIRDVTNASMEMEEKLKVKLVNISPGLLLLLSATVLVGVCATHNIPFQLTLTAPVESSIQNNSSNNQSRESDQPPIEVQLPEDDIPLPPDTTNSNGDKK